MRKPRIENPVVRRLLAGAFFVALFVAGFFFFLYLFFPYNRWKDDVERLLSEKAGRTITIEKIEGWRIVGVRLTGVAVAAKEQPPATPEAGAAPAGGGKKKGKGAAAPFLYVDGIAVRPAILGLLAGKRGAVFSVDIFDGSIDGEVSVGKKERSLRLSIDDIECDKITLLSQLPSLPVAGVPLFGTIEGKASFTYSQPNMSDLAGSATLAIDGLRLGDKNSTIDLAKTGAGGGIMSGAVKFEPVELGDLALKLEGDKGVLTVQKLAASSDHFELAGAGELGTRAPLAASTLNLYVKFRFKESYIQKTSLTKTIFATVDRIPQFRQAKRTDGFWGFSIRGSLGGKIKPVPARAGPNGM